MEETGGGNRRQRKGKEIRAGNINKLKGGDNEKEKRRLFPTLVAPGWKLVQLSFTEPAGRIRTTWPAVRLHVENLSLSPLHF
jgi:hypothetical protein